MKRVITFIFLMCFTLGIFAGKVSEQEALQRAQAFVQSNKLSADITKVKMAHKAPRKAKAAEESYYYVFNLDNNQGFIIVSGDDRTEAILGYADEGSFDAGQIPENMRSWLQYYIDEMQWMDEHGITVSRDEQTTAVPAAATATVNPLVQTKWNQGSPYNDLCPSINGTKCPTGCVATAMAQIMYYHRWPEAETSALDSYTTGSGITVSALPGITFDWDNMTTTYNNASSEASKQAVAELMQYCGSLMSMNYNTSGSGAYTFQAATRLPSYFNYPNTIQALWRDSYDNETWESIIVNELVNNRPVLYSGHTAQNEGHAFVCDGRRADGLYHINWGWGGSCDGYYRLSLLDPTAQGIGGSSTGEKFSCGQHVVIGISRTAATNLPATNELLSVGYQSIKTGREYTRANSSANFTGITVNTPFNFHSVSSSSYKYYGLALYKDGERLSILANGSSYYYPALYVSYPNKEQTLSFGAGLANGTYQIVPVCRNSANQWVKANFADNQYIEAVIDGNNLTLTIKPDADFEVTNVQFSGNYMVVDLRNNHGEYNGNIKLRNSDDEVVCSETVCIPANSDDQISLYMPTDKKLSSNDIYYLSTDYYDVEYFYSNGVNADANLSNSIELINADEAKTTVYGNKIRYTLTLQNTGSGPYHHNLTTELYQADNTENPAYSEKKIIDVPANSSVDLSLEFNLKTAEMGKTYFIRATHIGNNGNVSTQSNNFDVVNGAVYWDGNGQVTTVASGTAFVVPESAAAIDLRSVGTTNITPNSNPNTIYLLNSSVPTSLKGKNVVNASGSTGTLTFYDGYDYYIPEKIQTRKIYYKRTFSQEETGCWTTLALPFAPNVVKNDTDGQSLSWHTSETDSGKDLWIQELTAVNGDRLTFSNIATFTEYRPYILSVPESLAGKTLSFQKEMSGYTSYVYLEPGTEITRTLGGSTMTGTQAHKTIDGYVLQDDKFTKVSNGEIAPFRAYMTNLNPYTELLINSSHTTAIRSAVVDEAAKSDGQWYNLQGVRLQGQPNSKGIYIVNGKKVVIK